MTESFKSHLITIILLMVFSIQDISSQNIISEMDHDARHAYDRLLIINGNQLPLFHTSIFPYLRADLVALGLSIDHGNVTRSDAHQIQNIMDQNNEFIDPDLREREMIKTYADSTNTFYYVRDTTQAFYYRKSRKPLLKIFYRTPAFFYEVNEPDFYLRVNPLIRFGVGKETNEDVTTFLNQRGLSVRGGIGKNVYFYTSLYDSQVRYPHYINEYTDQYGVVPGAGFYKDYQSAFLKITEGRDFLIANAYAGIDFGKYIGLQLGHHQHFIGDGIRSLFLSDFSTPFFSLKFNTRIWKFHYQNIFAELAADNFQSVQGINTPVPKKYMAAHYLSFKPNRNLTLGLFETVIFNRDDHRFELQYLNPVILYRTVEGSIGSPDNVMLGLNARWDMKKSLSFYGQFILDDILIREVLKGNTDWWGNKFGHQLGVKYINAAGIDDLDMQVEWNQVRPYTYSHYNENANYSHYKQALAHPLGANFNEWILSGTYHVSPRLGLRSSVYLITKGEDLQDSISFGGDIIKPNILRPDDYGHSIGQGLKTNIAFWTSSVTYEISTGLFVDLQYLYRVKTSPADTRVVTQHVQLGARLNMARREDVF